MASLILGYSEPLYAVQSDEYSVVVEAGGVGIELRDLSRYANELRVEVKRILPGSFAENSGLIAVQDILVSVNGATLETSSAARAKDIIMSAARPMTLVFRRPGQFNELLKPSSENQDVSISTQIAPPVSGGDAQVLSVERTEIPELCTIGASKGDLLQISYTGRLVDGLIFDGSAVTSNAGPSLLGRGGDSSIFFVLGQQPGGQFPPGWDVGLTGMCCGEKRIIRVPGALGYGSKGLKRRKIPPNADLFYEVRLISVNGDARQH